MQVLKDPVIVKMLGFAVIKSLGSERSRKFQRVLLLYSGSSKGLKLSVVRLVEFSFW